MSLCDEPARVCRGCCAWPVGADLTFGHVRSRWLTITMSLMIIISYYSATFFFARQSGFCSGTNGGCGNWAILLQVCVIAGTEFVNWFSSQVNNPLRNKVWWSALGAIVILVQMGILMDGMNTLLNSLVDNDRQEILDKYYVNETNQYFLDERVTFYNQTLSYTSPHFSHPPFKEVPIFFLVAYLGVVITGGVATLYFLFRLCCCKESDKYYFFKRQRQQEKVLRELAEFANANKLSDAEQFILEGWKRYVLCFDDGVKNSRVQAFLKQLAVFDATQPLTKAHSPVSTLRLMISSIEPGKEKDEEFLSPREKELEENREVQEGLCSSLDIEQKQEVEIDTQLASPSRDYVLFHTPLHNSEMVPLSTSSSSSSSSVSTCSASIPNSPSPSEPRRSTTIGNIDAPDQMHDSTHTPPLSITNNDVDPSPPPPPPPPPPAAASPSTAALPGLSRQISDVIFGLAEKIEVDDRTSKQPSSPTEKFLREHSFINKVYNVLPHPRLPEDIVSWQAEQAKEDATNKMFGAIEIPSFVWISVIATLGLCVMLLGSSLDLVNMIQDWLQWALTVSTVASKEVCTQIANIPPLDSDWRDQLILFNATIPQDPASLFVHQRIPLLLSLGELTQYTHVIANTFCTGELRFDIQRLFSTDFTSVSTEFTVSQIIEFLKRSMLLGVNCARVAAVVAWIIVSLSTYYLAYGFRRVRGRLRVGLESRIPNWKPELYKVAYAPLLMGMLFSTALWGFWLSFAALTVVFFFVLSDVTWGILLNEAVWISIVQFAIVFAFKKIMEIICGRWISDGYTIKQPVLWCFYMSAMFAFGFITGFVSALVRLVFLAIISGLAIFRLDVTVFPSSLCNFDLAWVSFMSSVCLDHRHTDRAYLKKMEGFIARRSNSECS